MFDDKRHHVAGPTGGPGVLGPWNTAPRHDQGNRAQPTLLWHRIANRIRGWRIPGHMH